MTRCLFVLEVPVSYRTGWLEHTRAESDMDIHVIYLTKGQPDRPWEEEAVEADWVHFAEALALAKTEVSQLDAFAVTRGPGLPAALMVGSSMMRSCTIWPGRSRPLRRSGRALRKTVIGVLGRAPTAITYDGNSRRGWRELSVSRVRASRHEALGNRRP